MIFAGSDERINKAFRDMFRDFFTGGAMLDRYVEGLTNAMRLEEFVENGTCVIRAELPGIDPEKDIEISVSDGMVHLQAHHEEDRPSGFRSSAARGNPAERSLPQHRAGSADTLPAPVSGPEFLMPEMRKVNQN
jgi:HSP20 family protein